MAPPANNAAYASQPERLQRCMPPQLQLMILIKNHQVAPPTSKEALPQPQCATSLAQLCDTTAATHAPLALTNNTNKNHWVAPPTIKGACWLAACEPRHSHNVRQAWHSSVTTVMHDPLASPNNTNNNHRVVPPPSNTACEPRHNHRVQHTTNLVQLCDMTAAMHSPLASANNTNKNHWVAPPTIKEACWLAACEPRHNHNALRAWHSSVTRQQRCKAPFASANDTNKNHCVAPPTSHTACRLAGCEPCHNHNVHQACTAPWLPQCTLPGWALKKGGVGGGGGNLPRWDSCLLSSALDSCALSSALDSCALSVWDSSTLSVSSTLISEILNLCLTTWSGC